MFNWGVRQDKKAVNAIILGEGDEKGRPFKSRFLQAGLVKYDFGVCLLQKETIDKFIDTFKGCPVIINHKDNITESDKVGVVQNIWFSEQDGWFWCDGVLTDDKAVKLVENGYNVSCQYAITDYSNNTEKKLHNGNPYDKEILNGLFEHLAIVDNPRYEGAYIAVNAYVAQNAICRNEFKEEEHPRDKEGKFTDGGNSDSQKFNEEIDKIKSGSYPRAKQVTVSEKPSDVWLKAGLQNKKIVMPVAVFYKATTEKHNVDEETIRKFPELLQDPPFIFKSSTEKGSFVGVLDAVERDGKTEKPLIVAVKPINDRVEINIITSTYGKDKGFVKREIDKGNLLYRRKKTVSNSIIASLATETLNPSKDSITDNQTDFNPNATIKAINKYQPVFDWIRNFKGGTMNDTIEKALDSLLNALKARNEADDDKEKENDKKAENKKAKNEDVDKRKLIDEVAGIMKSAGADDELIRTAIAKMEKLAYDKSEAGTADNKAKNEDDEEGKEKDEEAKNKCKNKAKNEDEEKEEKYEELKEEVKKEAENKKAKNSMDALKRVFFEGEAPRGKIYMSQKEGIELGKKLY